ncbi:single-stranded DNA exonuclease RecJ [Candidatus Nanosynbacter lyticus]|uniref:Single-stranded-DNA-specific exonuclease RecJ n=1 Tax=Candidatus Nanosynbacter lyticus TaxID=2093824 RepID=A0A6S4GTK8_9BACT|nr:single-stranded-DNA-specific exonuclease RecJ [Candidatus Nanosynbacter lyticus]AJA06337.1 single-stranded DNA exonuclease RecJ [Candidatus Nanosynbacter lyticus]QCT41305.1 single-stranded-DNA-specific exonuclease RecJ [TM7 phylum sp. oral taxon 952]
MSLFEKILVARGLTTRVAREAFLRPDYAAVKHDPFLLPDMEKAVARLKQAREQGEKIVIYGDYDIDGLSATALLLDAFGKFGFEDVDAFIPNRFVEGYGMTMGAVDKVRDMGADLIVTVDTGSLCHAEIAYATSLGIDTVVTDHHNVAETPPPSVAAVNPKFSGHSYPFRDLCGAGVAFKLVQALQTELDGLSDGYEKWLLDLVALGTVCDIVTLADENRANVYWGLEVLKKQQRPGLKALMAVAGIEPEQVNARHLGFGLGPRMNAAGRLETAQHALDMLVAHDGLAALEASEKLEELNIKRRSIQDAIFEEACVQAEKLANDRVLVVSSDGWNHGVIGIVASKLVEKYKKPVFIIGERGEEATGSARSFGDFSAADAVRAADDIIIKGGGHGAAAGVTLETEKIGDFRCRVNEFYDSLQLTNQERYLLPKSDVEIDDFSEINEELVENLAKMEPFGNGNPEPVLKITRGSVLSVRRMGADGQHVKLALRDKNGKVLQMLAFNAPEEFFREPGDEVAAWFQPTVNEWQGIRSVEGRLLHLA